MNIQLPWQKKPRYSVCSERGPREENQDNFLIRQPNGEYQLLLNEQPFTGKSKAKTAGNWRFAVMDGMGGHAGGRDISERCAILLADHPAVNDVQALKELVMAVHHALYQEFHFMNSQASPGTTLTLVELDASKRTALMAHVGDSRIYLREGRQEPWQLGTEDHTAMTFAARLRGQAPIVTNTNQPLAQALGFGSFGVFPDKGGILQPQYDKNIRLDLSNARPESNDVRKVELPPNSQIILASDGIWHTRENLNSSLPLTAEQAEAFIPRPEMARDNMTVIMIEI